MGPAGPAGGLLPEAAGLGLEPLAVAYVLLVEQAVAERILARLVRCDAQIPCDRAGDYRVLVLTEHRLDLLHPLGKPGGLPASRWGRRFGRVAGPPDRLARPVQAFITLLARRRTPGPAHAPASLPVGAPRRGREYLRSRPGRLRAEGWLGKQPVKVVEQREVPV